MGNREAKELVCTTHGHELRRGEYGWEGDAEQRGIIGGEWDWDNSNSIINKIYFKKF